MDDYEKRYEAALQELEEAGIWRSNASPPYLRTLRSLGLRTRPPHYIPFFRVFLGQGLWFGMVWGALMWFVQWRNSDMTPTEIGATMITASALFGAFMAAYYAWGRRRHKLSRWQDL